MRSLHTRWRQLPQSTLFRWKLTRLASSLPQPARLPSPRRQVTDWADPASLALPEARAPGPPLHAASATCPPAGRGPRQGPSPLSQRGPGPASCRPAATQPPLLGPGPAIDFFLTFPQLSGRDPAPASLPRHQVSRVALGLVCFVSCSLWVRLLLVSTRPWKGSVLYSCFEFVPRGYISWCLWSSLVNIWPILISISPLK